MEKFKNKYRIQSNRKPDWAYSTNALYFLTIVTQNRKCLLGKIVNAEMILSDFGKIVEAEWHKSFEIRKELILHAFIVMPNHLHTIVEINQLEYDEIVCRNITVANTHDLDRTNTHDIEVEAHGRVPQPPNESTTHPTNHDFPHLKRNPPIRLPKSISSFIAGFKSAVNTKIDDHIDDHKLSIQKFNRKNHFFQPNYHDHIIRNEIEYFFIMRYIANNPHQWEKDKMHD